MGPGQWSMEFREPALSVEMMGERDDTKISNVHNNSYMGASMGSTIRSH